MKINIGTSAGVIVTLKVGEVREPVVIQGGSDILQTQSANLATTYTGRKITAQTLKTWIPARKTRRVPNLGLVG